MKYINPYYPWFDSVGTVYASGSKDGCFSLNKAGWSQVMLDEDSGTHIKMGLDMKFSFWYGNVSLMGFVYKKDETGLRSSVSVMHEEDYFRVNVDNKIFRTDFKTQKVNVWYRIFLSVDTVNGIVLFYVDGKKIGEYECIKTGVSVSSFRIYTDYNDIVCKNIIVTDGQLSPNETVIELTTSIDSNEWDVTTTEEYTTENVGKNIVLKPDKNEIDGYTITAASMVFENAISSDSVPAITASMGEKSERIQLPSSNSRTVWACFDGVDTLDDIVITSAE